MHGKQLIGYSQSAEGSSTFHSQNPKTGEDLPTPIHEATESEIARACDAAANIFSAFRATPAETRATFLEVIADEVEAIGTELIETVMAETGLPEPRCLGERGRATGQARSFATMVREGSWVDARIDLADPGRAPLPKPDVRSVMEPVGPVVVFGASNFPLAISVIGADTIAALGAGCPVVVKGHPAHANTCELLAEAVLQAAEKCGLPDGVFSLIQGRTNETGTQLVQHPAIRAAAFTGSVKGGRALMDVCAARPEPIPFYAEMGSVNPVFILPGALENAETLAQNYVGSLTLGVGQFCTNPALVFGLESDEFSAFKKAAAQGATESNPATMLHAGIHNAYNTGVDHLKSLTGTQVAGESSTAADATKSEAAVFVLETDAADFRDQPDFYEEVFGPVSTVVNCQSPAELEEFASKLDGSLTATIHGSEEDLAQYSGLVAVLQSKVGRLIFNGFPTGIEVCDAMHHGGPYPSSSHSYFTSIGTRTVYKFVRPVCYQSWPDAALPVELQNANPRGIQRMVDSELTKEAVEG